MSLGWAILLAANAATTGMSYEVEIRKSDSGADVLIGGKPFTSIVTTGTPKPYLYPVIGPTGASMTRGYPMDEANKDEEHDHPHHRSLWFAHGDIGGSDFWLEGEGKAVFSNQMLEVTSANSAAVRADLVSSAGKRLGGFRMTMHFYGDRFSRSIDFHVTITPDPSLNRLVFGDTKEGTMAIRTHPSLQLSGKKATGSAINSEGIRDKDVWGKRADWVDYWGQINGRTVGIAIFDNPSNPRHPTWWHARDYGLIAANPFGQHDFEKAEPYSGNLSIWKANELSLRYSFLFHEGDYKEAGVSEVYASWSRVQQIRDLLEQSNWKKG